MIDHAQARRIAGMLAAVGEPTRMLILHRLTAGPSHVGQLADDVGVPMVNMSHHLGVLRQAGLIEDNKEGRRVIYSLRPDVFTPSGSGGALGTLSLGGYRLVLIGGAAVQNGAAAPKPTARKKSGRKPAGG